MAATSPSGPHTPAAHTAPTAVIERGWFQRLQALEDAIAYRRARVSGPCPDCAASGHACDDHACDLQLIAAYQQTAIAAILDVSRRIDAGLADHDRGIFSAATTEKIR
jgi:hypothetical protein